MMLALVAVLLLVTVVDSTDNLEWAGLEALVQRLAASVRGRAHPDSVEE